MSTYTPKIPLEKSPLWKDVNEIADHVYAKLAELPEEEKFYTGANIRSSVSYMLQYTAQALGSGTPTGAQYELGNARKHVSSLKTLYRFAAKQKFFELDPAIMVKLNAAIKAIDDELHEAQAQTERANDQELEQWRKKHKLWKEMS